MLQHLRRNRKPIPSIPIRKLLNQRVRLAMAALLQIPQQWRHGIARENQALRAAAVAVHLDDAAEGAEGVGPDHVEEGREGWESESGEDGEGESVKVGAGLREEAAEGEEAGEAEGGGEEEGEREVGVPEVGGLPHQAGFGVEEAQVEPGERGVGIGGEDGADEGRLGGREGGEGVEGAVEPVAREDDVVFEDGDVERWGSHAALQGVLVVAAERWLVRGTTATALYCAPAYRCSRDART